MNTSQTLQQFNQHNLGPNGFSNLGANGFSGDVMAFAGHPPNCGPVATNVFQPGFPVGTNVFQPGFSAAAAVGQPWQQPNGRCGGFGGAAPGYGCQGGAQQPLPVGGTCSAWGGGQGCLQQRKRSLETDECVVAADWSVAKRQRPSLGDLEANVTIYNIAGTPNGFNGFGSAGSQSFQQMALPGSMQCDDGAAAAMNTSAVEHATSVTASRGYDAMYAYNIMLNEVYGS